MKNLIRGMAAVLLSIVFVLSAVADEGQKYTLRYKFHPGETIRWEVEHRSMVRATVSRDNANDRNAEHFRQRVAGRQRSARRHRYVRASRRMGRYAAEAHRPRRNALR